MVWHGTTSDQWVDQWGNQMVKCRLTPQGIEGYPGCSIDLAVVTLPRWVQRRLQSEVKDPQAIVQFTWEIEGTLDRISWKS